MTRSTIDRSILIGCLLSGFASASARAGNPPPIPLRIVTINVLQGVGVAGSNEAVNLGAFLTILDTDGPGPNTGLVPDVVCLQEVATTAQGQTDLVNFRNTYLPGYEVRTGSGDGFNFNATLIRPGITIETSSSLNVGGPRGVVKTRILVPGAAKPLWIYNAHFKCCGSASDRSQRTQNSTTSGNNVYFELNFGNPVANVIFAGDLNSNGNSDGTLTPLFFVSTNPVTPSGILNLAVETLAGAANPNVTTTTTFPGSSSRLDYVCLDTELASYFDADMSGTYNQTEVNSMGFVYYSNDDGGLRSNGINNATNVTSDHRPVVFDVLLPRDPNSTWYDPKDVDEDGDVDIEDLQLWENRFALNAPPAPSLANDIDGNRNVDLTDREILKIDVRLGEIADIAQY